MTKEVSTRSSSAEVAQFLAKAAGTPRLKAGQRGRLLFAMDATASREPTWDQACHLQSQMFEETGALGGLWVQLCYFRGHREFYRTQWVSDSRALLKAMSGVRCAGGLTQIERVLDHALAQTRQEPVQALVLVVDCMEENVDLLCHKAGELGLLGVPVFVFHEGGDAQAGKVFREIARLSRGAYCNFDQASAQHLRDLLGAVAVYAAGGRRALEDFGRRRGGKALALTHELNEGRSD